MLKKNIRQIFEKNNVNLVLLDLGASGGTYKPFERILNYSCLVEVDPDHRDFTDEISSKEKRIVVREAIIGNRECDSTEIHLTSDPHCSSTLRPDFSKLSNYSYAHLFEVQRTISVPATSLDRLSKKLNTHFDWLKIDTQGSELEILQSMQGALLDKLLCCDAEVSLYPHYIDAGSFSNFHDFMTSNGFQVANLIRVQSRLRLRKEDIQPFLAQGGRKSALNRWPTSLELRYIRAIGHDTPLPAIDIYLRLWLIAYTTGNHAYCFFLARRLEEDRPELIDLAKLLQTTCVQSAGFFQGLGKKIQLKLITAIERILGGLG